MSKFLKATIAALGLTGLAASATAEPLGLGRAATQSEIAAWDIDIRPDGAGLPDGSGDVATGEEIFADQCAVCHGDFGEGVARWPVLAGGQDTLADDRPVKTVGSYWPYLSTVWDYVHRAMPFGNAQSLTNDEVYAITAYILYLNDIVDEDFTLSRENFAETRLPNEDSFIADNRADSPVFVNREACMKNCKTSVEITARAAVLDVTPDETATQSEGSDAADRGTAGEPAAPDPELVAAGETVFRKCKACHGVGDKAKNKVGPILNGIVGAKIGTVDGFRYSKIFKSKAGEGATWDTASLDAFLTDPRSWAKGTKMRFKGLKADEDRAAVIAYLQSFP